MSLRTTISRRDSILTLASFAGACLCRAGSDDAYIRALEEERKHIGETFKSTHGPLTLLARFSPTDGSWTLGSDPACSLVVPSSKAPPHVGAIKVKAGKAALQFAPGMNATANGKPIHSLDADAQTTKPVTATVGDLSLHLYFIRGEQLQVSVSDPNSRLRREAQPLSWFPIDKRYRIVADWIAYDQPRHVMFLDNDGSRRERNIPGFVRFHVAGKQLTMTAVLRPDNPKLFFVFGDTTNGHESYGAGRFLEADPSRNGKVTLDFNTAHNPLCAYNHEYLCPVAPRENRLTVAIRAGERTYPGSHA